MEESEISFNADTSILEQQEWKSEHETILVDWADKAMCYRWLHAQSHQSYSKTNAWFTIPVIIMSTLTGTANFAQDKFPDNMKTYAQMAIGAVNIFAGILTTIQQFLKISELNEAHRASSISWDKFYRNIKVELAKSREERIHVSHMLKMCKEEFDRLMETSPSINEEIIKKFNKTFPLKIPMEPENEEDALLKADIKRPEICDELVSTADFVYKQPIIDPKQPAILAALKKKENSLRIVENQVKNFISKFLEKHHRNPLESEIFDNLQQELDNGSLMKVIKKINEEEKINTDSMV
tara:strand:+ start:1018 stop:1905 length:888 start_codon:yes stop_codon:yes gene_type:complete